MLAALVKQPEPDPDDPEGHPGYDPARGGRAAATRSRGGSTSATAWWRLGYLTTDEAAGWRIPHTVRDLAASVPQYGLDRPTGLVVNHVLSELRQTEPFRGKPRDYIRNGGFRIVTTVDKRAQDAAEASADIRRPTAPAAVQGQPRQLAGRAGRGRAGHGSGAGLLRRQRRHRRRLRGMVLRRGRRGAWLRSAPARLVVQGLRPGRGAAAGDLAAVEMGLAGRPRSSPPAAGRKGSQGGTGPQRLDGAVPADLHALAGDRRVAERAVLRADRAARAGRT